VHGAINRLGPAWDQAKRVKAKRFQASTSEVYGDPSIHLIDGFVRLMNSPDALAGPVNLGNPGEFTMIELAEAVKELTGSRSELVHEPLPQDDPKQRQPDITLARAQLGWEPKVALREGLRPTIAYFEGLLSLGFGTFRPLRPSRQADRASAPGAGVKL
jgi:nucleoside-diphosphate-sugar epimerase